MKNLFPLPPFLLSDLMGQWVTKQRIHSSYVNACPPGKGGNKVMLISIFQPILMDHGSFTETPAAADTAWGPSPYLIQFVNAGADGSEFAVWDPTNCKHPIKDAPVVNLGKGSSTSGITNSSRCFSHVLLHSTVLSMEENTGDICQGVFFAIFNFYFPFLGS